MNRILGIIAIVVGLALSVTWYVHRSKTRAMNTGEVFVRQQSTDNAKPAAPDHVAPTQPSPEVATESAPPAIQPSMHQSTPTLPASETISRNPPNGLAFNGAGKYTIYRQGDITWRLDTETGRACILLATDAQWRRTRVYESGCGVG